MSVTLSIIVPVYKVEEYLDHCIESLLNQPFKDFELILVDDGSPDRCGTMCDQWAERDERIKVIHQANQGLSAARNSGLEIARGRYLSFIDSDDAISNDFFAPNIEWLEQHPEVDLIRLNVESINETTQACRTLVQHANYELISTPNGCLQTLFGAETIGVWQSIYRAKVWHTMRFPVGLYHEDDYLKPELSTIARTIALSPHGTYLYLLRDGSITGTRLSTKRLNDIITVRNHMINHLAQVSRWHYYGERYKWFNYAAQINQECEPSDADALIDSLQSHPAQLSELLTLKGMPIKVSLLSILSILVPTRLLLRIIRRLRRK